MRGMYSSYKKDQQAPKAYWRVCSQEDFEGYGPLYPAFEKAICDLPNLREIEIRGPDDHDRPMWRDTFFDPNIEHEFDIRVHGAIEAAAMAFMLRSIGSRNSSNSSLTRLRIEFPVMRWGPRDVYKAWESIARRREFDDDLSRAKWVQKQMSLTRGAFTHLKTLHLETKMKQAGQGNHCPVLGDWFASAPGLQCLELDMESYAKEDDGDALRGIVEHCQLPALQDLTLTIQDTTVDSLITLLSRVSDTLRSLRLCDCVLFEDEDTWPNFYERMRDIPFKQLCHLDFSRCADFDEDMPDKSHDEDMILAVKEYADEIRDSAPPETVIHESLASRKLWKGYSSDLYRYLLKETALMPALYLYHTGDEESSDEDSSDDDSSTDDSSTDADSSTEDDSSTDDDSSDDDSSVEGA